MRCGSKASVIWESLVDRYCTDRMEGRQERKRWEGCKNGYRQLKNKRDKNKKKTGRLINNLGGGVKRKNVLK